MDGGERAQEPKNIQQPQNHADHDNAIENRLNRSCHRYVTIDQPEENTDDDQYQYELN